LLRDAQRHIYFIGVVLVFGLVCGLWGVLIGGLDGLLIYGLGGGLVFGLVFGLGNEIKPVEVLKWSWKKAKSGLVYGPVVGLVVGLGGGLFTVLVFGLIGGLIGGLSHHEIELRTTPNQGIKQSGKNSIIGGLVVGLFMALGFGLMGLAGELFMALGFGLGGGLVFGLVVGGAAWLQHYLLRFLLYCSGAMPWNLTRFLDYAADRIFLRKVGGGYIFIHRLLMEYFASLEPEQK
jgi:hypothetical protein